MTGPAAVPGRIPAAFLANVDQYLPHRLKGRDKDYFVYTAEFLPLTASLTQSFNIAIQADSSFLILATQRIVTDVANTTFLAAAPELVLLTDTGSGRQLMDRAVHMESLFGTAQRPYIWYPKLIQASSTLNVQVQNLEAIDRNVRLSFEGFKIF